MQTKYLVVTGGVCSSIGKGIATASLGAIFKAGGYKVFIQKLDPYLNVDPGTMNPFQHGEVFVLEDGAETDLDLGHYERFIQENLNELSTVTTGKVYSEVIAQERKGAYLGGTIQVIPHITNAIKKRIIDAGKKSEADIVLIEIGGTTGDIEGLPYLEAIRQLRQELGPENMLILHMTFLPFLKGSKELKTKPTQASVRELRSYGIQPDIILARADHHIKKELLQKIATFCDTDEEAVLEAPTVDSIYEVPLNLASQNVANLLSKKLKLENFNPDLSAWEKLVEKIHDSKEDLRVALVGKYTGLDDSYLSVIESLKIACYHQNRKLKLIWIDAEKLEKKDEKTWNDLKSASGIVVPGGFGIRGTEGKILAAKYCRENQIPYLGLCLGMQIMSIEFARFIYKDKNFTSQEFDEEEKLDRKYHVIEFMPDQYKERDKGGTLRLGTYPCKLSEGSLTKQLYAQETILERHRHRYEFNNSFKADFEKNGMHIAGIFEQADLVEILELKNHPFMIGSQFHPEFLSRP